jgi:hypothetical protein
LVREDPFHRLLEAAPPRLQQCEQTDLLPDQRSVQLISLDRHGLETERDD